MLKKIEVSDLTALINEVKYTVLEGTTITICCIELHSGFSVIGKSATIDKANFDKSLGEKYAYEDAFSNLWELEGYHRLATEYAKNNDVL